MLSKAGPGVLKDIALKQQALRIFQLENILDNKWAVAWGIEPHTLSRIGVYGAHESGLAGHPD